jgi:hypothetical protein
LPGNILIEIVIHLPSDELLQASASDIASAIKDYFDLRSRAVSREMGELFKAERLSLVVGLAILSVCLLLGWLFVQRMNESPLSQILTESFLILGWVAIWKPSETFSTLGLRLPPAGNFSPPFRSDHCARWQVHYVRDRPE